MPHVMLDPQNRILFYGNPVGYIYSLKDNTAVADTAFKSDYLEESLSRMNLKVSWESGVYDYLTNPNIPNDRPVEPLKRCRIWQLKPEVEIGMKFLDYDQTVQRYGKPDISNYQVAFDGQLGTNDLNEIADMFSEGRMDSFSGHALGISDVIELYDENASDYYFCDRSCFRVTGFTKHSQVQSSEQTLEPNN